MCFPLIKRARRAIQFPFRRNYIPRAYFWLQTDSGSNGEHDLLHMAARKSIAVGCQL